MEKQPLLPTLKKNFDLLQNEFKVNSFREMDSFGGGAIGINCQLSPLSVFSLTTGDVITDTNWDIYDKILDARCTSGMRP